MLYWPATVILTSGRSVDLGDVIAFCHAEGGRFIGPWRWDRRRFMASVRGENVVYALGSVEEWKFASQNNKPTPVARRAYQGVTSDESRT